MSTATLTGASPHAPLNFASTALRDFKSRADPRRELIWTGGRLLLIATFFGIYFSQLEHAAEFITFAVVGSTGLVVSTLSTWLVLQKRVFPAFAIGTAYDLLAFTFAWTALLFLAEETLTDSDGWLTLFPVLISLPYRLGTIFGMVSGIIILVWIGTLHVILLPSGAHMLEHMAARWSVLAATLLITAAFNFALTRRTQALVEQTNRAEFLKGQNEAKSEFIDTVSHELRTPITVVLALIRRLMRNSTENLSEQELEHLQVVMRNADQLSELISDLLEVTKIEHGTLEYRNSTFSLNEFVREIADNIQPVTAARSQTINVTTSPGESPVCSDHARLTQVMNNLITNASKYSSDGSEIMIHASVEPNSAQVEVTNPAGELTAQDIERMFEMFYRADNEQTRSESGTGLGLHICKRIVEHLEGEISARIDDGQIAIRFSLPR